MLDVPTYPLLGAPLRDEGWWYQVRSVIRCRECRQCNVRKESAGFPLNEGRKKQRATCAHCVLEQHAGQASVHASRRASTGKQEDNNRKGDPELRISEDSLPEIQHLSRMRVKRKGLTGTSAMG